MCVCVCECVCVCVCVCGAHSFAELVEVNESQFLVGLFSPHCKPRHEVGRTQKPPAHTHTHTQTHMIDQQYSEQLPS